jgi:predicted  nucleic acid-binding Zn-ribbon protein
MERLEELSTGLAAAQEAMDRIRREAQEAAAAWERRQGEMAAETADLEARRAQVVAELPAELVALYEKVHQRSGQGAAPLRHGRCGACQLQLSSSDLDRVRTAAPDDVVRCEECGAIMVRVPESGL